jgi:toxin CptA
MPLRLLLPTERLVVQTGLALADALGCLFLLLLSREFRLTARVGLLSLALYLALPINITMLWWGFATNALAQSSGLALLWMLLRLVRRPSRGALAAFVVICCICMLMHVGALVLVMGLLGTGLLLGWRRQASAGRNVVIGGLAIALASTALLYFSAVVDPALARPLGGPGRTVGEMLAKSWHDRGIRYGLLSQGLLLGFLPLPLALTPLGIAQLLRAEPGPPLRRPLIVAWLLICLLFMAIYFGTNLLVRYVYFATPLFCLGLGMLLDGLWRRGGRAVALALLLLVISSGIALWIAGVLVGVKPSLLPLTQ